METCLLNHFLLNEELKSTCDFNPELLGAGRGIYEVFRVIGGTPLFLDQHLDRFYQSVKLGGFTFKLSKQELKGRLKVLISSNGLKTGNVQFHLIDHPVMGTLLSAWVAPHRYPDRMEVEEGVVVKTLHAVRSNPHLKSTNLPARILANEKIRAEQIYEVLLVDDREAVTEGSRSNIFFIREGIIYTPSLTLVLEGITRAEVVQIAIHKKIDLHNTVIPLAEIGRYQSAFLTSTSMKVLPVKQIDEQGFNPQNDLLRRLMEFYEEAIALDLERFSW